MNFGKRLFNILKDKKISNADLARETGLSTARISNFINGKDMPSFNNALILVNYFQCSFNYLFDLTDQSITITTKREFDIDKFLKRIEILSNVNSLSQRSLSKQIGINKSCITNWRTGQKPNMTTLIKLAIFFNCTIDNLLGFKEQ